MTPLITSLILAAEKAKRERLGRGRAHDVLYRNAAPSRSDAEMSDILKAPQ